MAEFFMQYGLFLAKTTTILIAILIVLGVGFMMSKKSRALEKLEIKRLNDKFDSMRKILRASTLPKKEYKKFIKRQKSEAKAKEKQRAEDSPRKRFFVLEFRGDIKATAVASLREEVTAVLTMATPEDGVLLRLENTGGIVHEHGLAASQLQRFRDKNIPLTVAVDKVAASGGYMMACVADRILAAPFAIIGSIGVLAQLPNFHDLLARHGIEFEQETAGEFKRTITMFGRNTDAERAKLREQLEDTHQLFKDFVAEHRPNVNLKDVATGEYWHGIRALERNLVDELVTSDDFLLAASDDCDIYEVTYSAKKTVTERLMSSVQLGLVGWADTIKDRVYRRRLLG
ncbi:MAG: protease SohB [Gammaproteobacteria bacterium]|nr:protease SohB [Gammaproteobacteria bacterium]